MFTRYIKESEVKKIWQRDFGHTHVALLINLKEYLLNIQNRLGHTDARITLNIYEHLHNDKDREHAEKWDRSM